MNKHILTLTALLSVAHAHAQNSWTIVPSGTTQDLNAMEYNFMVGDSGTLLTSADNGSTWTALNSNTAQHLNDLIFCGSGCFYFCGDSGFVAAAFSNGAVITDRSIAGKNEPIHAMTVFGSDQPMVVSDSGYFGRSTNGGVAFAEIQTNTDEHLYSAGGNYSFTTNNFACGSNGTILISSSGGTSWTAVPAVTSNDLFDVYTTQSSASIAVGDNGTILRAAAFSNGQVWSVIPCPVTTRLNAVARDGQLGGVMAVGNGGVILRSLDDGLTWTQLISGSNEDLYDVFPWSGSVWNAIGANGTILRSTDGGGSGVGIEEHGSIKVTAFPNPARDHITIQWNEGSSAMANVQLLDVLGQVLWSGSASLAAPFNVDLSDHEAGAYFIRVVPQDAPAAVVRVEKVG